MGRPVAVIVGLGLTAFTASLYYSSPFASAVYTSPFAVLLWMSCSRGGREQRKGEAAAIGAILPIVMYHALMLYDVVVRSPKEGYGANIGLGILGVFVLPVLIVICSYLGWGFADWIGKAAERRK